MSRDHRLKLLASVTVVACAAIFLQPPIPQDSAYHDFADQRTTLGIPHCLNVVSNLPFIVVGAFGLWWLLIRGRIPEEGFFLSALEVVPYAALFAAVFLTGFGSSYYHLKPDTERLFWDRLPMSIAFMSLLATAITERIDRRGGLILLVPLIGYGIFSVCYWRLTEQVGAGDLRYYVLAQLLPVLLVPLMAGLLPSPYSRSRDLYVVAALYIAAKLAEVGDVLMYGVGYIISGHSLKHLIAAAAAWWILRMLRRREPL